MAKLNYELASKRERVRKYGSLNDSHKSPPIFKKKHKVNNDHLWTDWFFIKGAWTRELRLTDTDQPWD